MAHPERQKLPLVHPILTSKYDHPDKWPNLKPIDLAPKQILDTADDMQALFKPDQQWQPEAFSMWSYAGTYDIEMFFRSQKPPTLKTKFRLPWPQTLVDLPSTLKDPSLIKSALVGNGAWNSHILLKNMEFGPFAPFDEYRSRPGIKMTGISAFPLFLWGNFMAEDSSRLSFNLILYDALTELKKAAWRGHQSQEISKLKSQIAVNEVKLAQLQLLLANQQEQLFAAQSYNPSFEQINTQQLFEKMKSLPFEF